MKAFFTGIMLMAGIASGIHTTQAAETGEQPVPAVAEDADAAAMETYLGVSIERASSDLLAHLKRTPGIGLVVTFVEEGGPAAQAGVQVNDLLLSLDGQHLVNAEQLRVLVAMHQAGDTVSLSLLREAESLTIPVSLAERAVDTLAKMPSLDDPEGLGKWLANRPGTDFIDQNHPEFERLNKMLGGTDVNDLIKEALKGGAMNGNGPSVMELPNGVRVQVGGGTIIMPGGSRGSGDSGESDGGDNGF